MTQSVPQTSIESRHSSLWHIQSHRLPQNQDILPYDIFRPTDFHRTKTFFLMTHSVPQTSTEPRHSSLWHIQSHRLSQNQDIHPHDALNLKTAHRINTLILCSRKNKSSMNTLWLTANHRTVSTHCRAHNAGHVKDKYPSRKMTNKYDYSDTASPRLSSWSDI